MSAMEDFIVIADDGPVPGKGWSDFVHGICDENYWADETMHPVGAAVAGIALANLGNPQAAERVVKDFADAVQPPMHPDDAEAYFEGSKKVLGAFATVLGQGVKQ